MCIVGEYSNGEKTGQWFYFYSPALKDTSVLFLLGQKKLTGVISPKKKDEEFQITIDTTGIKLAATGNFEKNKKSKVTLEIEDEEFSVDVYYTNISWGEDIIGIVSSHAGSKFRARSRFWPRFLVAPFW